MSVNVNWVHVSLKYPNSLYVWPSTHLRWLSVSVMPWEDTLKWTTVHLEAGRGAARESLVALATASRPVRLSMSTLLMYSTLHAGNRNIGHDFAAQIIMNYKYKPCRPISCYMVFLACMRCVYEPCSVHSLYSGWVHTCTLWQQAARADCVCAMCVWCVCRVCAMSTDLRRVTADC